MTTATLPTPAERLALLIDWLCKAVAAHGVRGLLTAPLLLLLWSRLSRMARRARRLAARMAAGLPPSTPRPPAATRAAPATPYIRLPQGVTWLVRAVPATSVGAATLQFLLADPEMAALAQTPPMRRLLRPLCRMLGVAPPPIPKRQAATPEAAPPPLPTRQIEPASPSGESRAPSPASAPPGSGGGAAQGQGEWNARTA